MAERSAFDIGKIFNRGKRRLGMILGLDQRTKAQRGSSFERGWASSLSAGGIAGGSPRTTEEEARLEGGNRIPPIPGDPGPEIGGPPPRNPRKSRMFMEDQTMARGGATKRQQEQLLKNPIGMAAWNPFEISRSSIDTNIIGMANAAPVLMRHTNKEVLQQVMASRPELFEEVPGHDRRSTIMRGGTGRTEAEDFQSQLHEATHTWLIRNGYTSDGSRSPMMNPETGSEFTYRKESRHPIGRHLPPRLRKQYAGSEVTLPHEVFVRLLDVMHGPNATKHRAAEYISGKFDLDADLLLNNQDVLGYITKVEKFAESRNKQGVGSTLTHF